MTHETCHVCGKIKKPYNVFLKKDDVMSLYLYYQAREDGPICERCYRYYTMTGVLKDATDIEFEIARQANWFSKLLLEWWQKDKYLTDIDDINIHEWTGTDSIKRWCREYLERNKNKVYKYEN